MPLTLEETSTITAKGQTTIPKSVRLALGVDYGGKIAFRVGEHGVTVHRVEAEAEDPAIVSFLALMAADIQRHPEKLTELTPELGERLKALTEGIEVDLDAPIEGDVDL